MPYDYNLSEVDRITGIDEKNRNKIIRYYYELPEVVRIKIHERIGPMIRTHRDKLTKGKAPEYSYSIFVLTIVELQRAESGKKMARKMSTGIDEAAQIAEARIAKMMTARKPNPSPTRDDIERLFFETITQLRQPQIINGKERKMAWRKLSDYIAKYHKKRIHYGTLRRCYNEIVLDKQMRGELDNGATSTETKK